MIKKLFKKFIRFFKRISKKLLFRVIDPMAKLENLVREGYFDFELGVANPRSTGVSAGDGALGKATDGTRWIKVGAGDADWEKIFITTNGSFPFTHANTIYVAKNGTDTRTGLDPHDFANPFLTLTAAQTAASSGDTIIVFAGDYSSESFLTGKDGVNWKILQGAITPDFLVVDAITFMIEGDIEGEFQADDAGTNVTIKGNVNGDLYCTNGATIRLSGDVSGFILCTGAANLRLQNGRGTHDGATWPPLVISGSSVVELINYRIESTESGAEIISLSSSWSGSLFGDGLKLVNITVATDEATTGIAYGTSVTGKVNLKDCTIITAQDGTGTAKAIDAPSAQTVYIQGSLNITHAVDADITLAGGAAIANTNFTS